MVYFVIKKMWSLDNCLESRDYRGFPSSFLRDCENISRENSTMVRVIAKSESFTSGCNEKKSQVLLLILSGIARAVWVPPRVVDTTNKVNFPPSLSPPRPLLLTLLETSARPKIFSPSHPENGIRIQSFRTITNVAFLRFPSRKTIQRTNHVFRSEP